MWKGSGMSFDASLQHLWDVFVLCATAVLCSYLAKLVTRKSGNFLPVLVQNKKQWVWKQTTQWKPEVKSGFGIFFYNFLKPNSHFFFWGGNIPVPCAHQAQTKYCFLKKSNNPFSHWHANLLTIYTNHGEVCRFMQWITARYSKKKILWMHAGSFHDLAMHSGQNSALDFHGWNSFCMKNNWL